MGGREIGNEMDKEEEGGRKVLGKVTEARSYEVMALGGRRREGEEGEMVMQGGSKSMRGRARKGSLLDGLVTDRGVIGRGEEREGRTKREGGRGSE